MSPFDTGNHGEREPVCVFDMLNISNQTPSRGSLCNACNHRRVIRISVNVGRLARAVSLAPKYEYVAASDATTAWQGWGRGLPLPLSSYSLFFSIQKGMGKASFESSCFLDSGVPTSLESFVLVRSSNSVRVDGELF